MTSAVVFGAATRVTDTRDYDHLAAQAVLRHLREGMDFYPAFAAGYADLGTQLGSGRAFRTPPVFLLWRALPSDEWIFPLFLATVAVTGLCLARITPRAWPALPAVALLLFTGRRPGTEFAESWLVVELWSVPFIAGSLLAWQRDRRVLAACLALVAACSREPAMLLLLGGLLASWVGQPERRLRAAAPWGLATLVFLGLFGLHLHVASGHAAPFGNDVPLVGTADLPFSVTGMMQPLPVGIVLWLLALAHIRRSRDASLPALPLLLLPLAGLVVQRDYWGILLAPLTIVWGIDELLDVRRDVLGDRQRTLAATADNSPLTNLPESSVE